MSHCLPCLVGNYDLQCRYCNKGYCFRCFRRAPNTGGITCHAKYIGASAAKTATLRVVGDKYGGFYIILPTPFGRHSFKQLRPEPPEENI